MIFLELIENAKQCKACDIYLPFGAKPVFSVSKNASILIVGQAPGIRVHHSGTPFNDQSGDRLRDWMSVDKETFYDSDFIGILPMGFCYPGTGKTGDLPPRKECAPLWHASFLDLMPNIKLTLLIGQYAQGYYLNQRMKQNVTETVKHWKNYMPKYLPLPHPSPRNNRWFKQNPWFESEVIPVLRKTISVLKSN